MSEVNKLPDAETGQTELHQRFKKDIGLNTIAGIPLRDGWTRKGVITNYSAAHGVQLVNNVDAHFNVGYRFVLGTEAVKDDRAFSPNTNSRPNTIPGPVTGKTSDGFEYVVMEIEHSKEREMMEKLANSNSSNLVPEGSHVTHKNGQIIIKDKTTNFDVE